MKCPNCEFEIGEKDTICKGCGESVFNLKKSIEDNTINIQKEVPQIKTNSSSPIGNENITNKQDLNYNSVLSTSELKKEQIKNETLEEIEVLNNPENGMKCPKCGTNVQHDWNFCPSCHNKLNDNAVNIEEKYVPSKKEKKIFWIVIICILSPLITYILTILWSYFMYYLGETISMFIYLFLIYFTPLSYITALILLIYGKNKYPRNKTINIMFKIFITLLILATVFFAIVIPFSIIDTLEKCRTMG